MTKEFLLTTLGINDTRLIPEALMTVLFGDPVNRQKFYRAILRRMTLRWTGNGSSPSTRRS